MLRIVRFCRSTVCDAPTIATALQCRYIYSGHACQQAEPLPAENDTVEHSVPTREFGAIRTDWTREEVNEVYSTPLLELVFKAASVHRVYNDPQMVQRCTLLSIKTGGCPETCTYCSQSSSWRKETGLKAEKLMDLEETYQAALRAKESGSTRFCMGAAWRGPSQVGKGQWERVLEMVARIRGLGMEVCTTLGMLTPEQAKQLREAGLTAYNHNLDTSPEYYGKITSSRKYEDRLETLANVRDAGISVCAGGIIGMGEGNMDRVGLLHQLATLPEHPESVPINALVAVKGTPLQDQPPPSALEVVRCIATARIVMPRSVVRLSAGRLNFSLSDQALCFMAGANSIFDGDKLLTTPNNERNEDLHMFETLGLRSRPAFLPYSAGAASSNGSCGSSGQKVAVA
ncbi:g3056 [Coccomyxa elongata]